MLHGACGYAYVDLFPRRPEDEYKHDTASEDIESASGAERQKRRAEHRVLQEAVGPRTEQSENRLREVRCSKPAAESDLERARLQRTWRTIASRNPGRVNRRCAGHAR